MSFSTRRNYLTSPSESFPQNERGRGRAGRRAQRQSLANIFPWRYKLDAKIAVRRNSKKIYRESAGKYMIVLYSSEKKANLDQSGAEDGSRIGHSLSSTQEYKQ